MNLIEFHLNYKVLNPGLRNGWNYYRAVLIHEGIMVLPPEYRDQDLSDDVAANSDVSMFYGHPTPCLTNFISFISSECELPDFKNKAISVFSLICNTIYAITNPKEKNHTLVVKTIKENVYKKTKNHVEEKDYTSYNLILSMVILV